MKTSEAIRYLASMMEDLDPKNEVLKLSILAMLDKTTAAAEQKKEPAPEKKTKKRKSSFDLGKAKACLYAGWSIAKIADEMGCTDQTVRNNFQKAGISY